MTHEEFLEHAEQEIEQAFKPAKGRLMNLIQQALAEGKKNAEVSGQGWQCPVCGAVYSPMTSGKHLLYAE